MDRRAILRLPEVLALTGLSRSTIYVRISQGLWPPGIKLGPRAVGWPAHEALALVDALIEGIGEDEICKLVTSLKAARQGAK